MLIFHYKLLFKKKIFQIFDKSTVITVMHNFILLDKYDRFFVVENCNVSEKNSLNGFNNNFNS